MTLNLENQLELIYIKIYSNLNYNIEKISLREYREDSFLEMKHSFQLYASGLFNDFSQMYNNLNPDHQEENEYLYNDMQLQRNYLDSLLKFWSVDNIFRYLNTLEECIGE